MEIRIDLGKNKRKDLAMAIGEILGADVVYKKAPTYAYEIGGVTLDRENTLTFANGVNPTKLKQFITLLENKGFSAELPDKLVIQMPLDDFDSVALENLRKLVTAKGELIKKALSVEDLPIELTDEAICFPWLAFDTPAEDVAAYSQFISLNLAYYCDSIFCFICKQPRIIFIKQLNSTLHSVKKSTIITMQGRYK